MEDSRSRGDQPDPYEVLGVPAGASRQEIARAYRRAAHAAHPDAQPQDPQAVARFRALTDAYETLSDPGRRAGYDRGHPGRHHPRLATHPETAFGARGGIAPPARHAQPLWAGPVYVQPAGPAAAEQRQEGDPGSLAHYRDPDVYLGVRPFRAGDGAW